jgi:hypothetical protein
VLDHELVGFLPRDFAKLRENPGPTAEQHPDAPGDHHGQGSRAHGYTPHHAQGSHHLVTGKVKSRRRRHQLLDFLGLFHGHFPLAKPYPEPPAEANRPPKP